MALMAALENYNCLSFVKNWPQFFIIIIIIIIIIIVFFASQVIYTQEILL